MTKRSISRKNGGKNTNTKCEETATEVCTSACLSLWDSFLMLDHRFTTHLAVCATVESPFGHLRPLMKILEISCHWAPWLIACVICILGSQKSRDTVIPLNLVLALFQAGVVAALMKLAIRRRRPSHNVSDMVGVSRVEEFSFPSGHATHAAVAALFVSHHVFSNPLCMVMTYLWAGAVCISRILLGRHHIVDVVCGILIGIASYYTYLRLWLTEAVCMSYLDTYFGHVHL